MKTVITSIISLLLTASAAPQKPVFCTHDPSHEETYCKCLDYHPEMEFCKDETAPLPSCCKATEKDSKITSCGCCAGEGDKKIDARKRGTYKHEPPIVEYRID